MIFGIRLDQQGKRTLSEQSIMSAINPFQTFTKDVYRNIQSWLSIECSLVGDLGDRDLVLALMNLNYGMHYAEILGYEAFVVIRLHRRVTHNRNRG